MNQNEILPRPPDRARHVCELAMDRGQFVWRYRVPDAADAAYWQWNREQKMKETTTDSKELNYIRALLHGESGKGKSTMLGTLPVDRTVLAVLQRGALPLRKQSFKTFLLESWPDVQELYRRMREPVMIGNQAATVLAIDALEDISELCKEQIVKVDRRGLVKERTKGAADKPVGLYDEMLTMEDWGLYRNRMSALISAFCHLSMHVVFNCLSQWTEDKRTGTVLITPGLNGKLAMECPAQFDLVLYIKSQTDAEGKPTRSVQTFNDGQILCKDASGALDEYEPTDWSKIFRKIIGTPKNKKEAASVV